MNSPDIRTEREFARVQTVVGRSDILPAGAQCKEFVEELEYLGVDWLIRFGDGIRGTATENRQ